MELKEHFDRILNADHDTEMGNYLKIAGEKYQLTNASGIVKGNWQVAKLEQAPFEDDESWEGQSKRKPLTTITLVSLDY
jgi:hypothetical protein